jgi:hypothetical protein
VPDESWIDPHTDVKLLSLCTGYNAECEKPGSVNTTLELVFSDEFLKDGRNFALSDRDRKWTAVDIYYSRDDKEAQNYKPDAITTEGGVLKITISNETWSAGAILLTARSELRHWG